MIRIDVHGHTATWDDEQSRWSSENASLERLLNFAFNFSTVPSGGHHWPYPPVRLATAAERELGAVILEVAPPEEEEPGGEFEY